MEMKKNRYKLLLLCLVFTFLGGRAAYANTGFNDVAEKDWFYKGVVYASSNKLLEDTGETAFKPASAIDRTEFIVALYNYSTIKGYDVSVGLSTNILSYDDAFDIREGACEAFQWACGSGLIPDAGASKLEPNSTVSREQMIKIMYDYALLYGISPTAGEDTNILSYTDVSDIKHNEAYRAFQWACGTGIINGTSASTLSPSDSVTRAQLVTVLLRLSEKETVQTEPASGPVKVVTFQEYTVKGDRFEADIKVPQIQGLANKTLENSLNEKYRTEGKQLYDQFLDEMKSLKNGEGSFSVNSGYMTKTETDRLLSIGRYTLTVMASGAEKLKYDTIDKEKQILITLPGLFQDKSYVDIISNCIKSQMKEQMQADAGIIYWVDSKEGLADDFDKILENQNFYITEDGKLVISFDEYEVAPGSMGIVEFTIPTKVILPILVSDEYIK